MTGETILETKGLGIVFGEYRAVNDVNFTIADRDCAGIIGPNGAGKTTFFNLLTGMYKPTEGRIMYRGDDVTALKPDQRVTRGMIRTFQLVSVFDSLTVLENMILPIDRFQQEFEKKGKFYFSRAESSHIREQCISHLKRVGIEKRVDDLAANLSYGEKRKLEIAMSLSLKPTVLLLDEPLAGLSDVEIKEVIGLVGSLKGEFTILMIEHKISQIQNLVSRLSVMHEGRMIAQGAPMDIIHDKEIRRIYWGAAE